MDNDCDGDNPPRPDSRSDRVTEKALWPLIATLVLASGLWFVTFVVSWSSFWIKISISAAILALSSIVIQRGIKARIVFDLKSIFLGLILTAMLYGIFFLGKVISTWVFSFADRQIDGIYGLGEGWSLWSIALLLFFVTGPSEELYWRGFLQRSLSERLGGFWGYALATVLYAGVHLWTLNVVLVGAAAVAGAFWGFFYWRLDNLAPIIISHSIWSAVIFAVLPLH